MAVVRFALYVDLMLLFGMPAFLLYNARETPECEGLFGSTLRVLAVLALALSVFGFALLCADMVGVALWELDRPTVGAILWQTPIGIAWIARMAALIIYLGLALSLDNRPHPAPCSRRDCAWVAGLERARRCG